MNYADFRTKYSKDCNEIFWYFVKHIFPKYTDKKKLPQRRMENTFYLLDMEVPLIFAELKAKKIAKEMEEIVDRKFKSNPCDSFLDLMYFNSNHSLKLKRILIGKSVQEK